MRNILAAMILALAAPTAALAEDAAPAQASVYAGLTQIELTDADVLHYIAAIPDMQRAMAAAPDDSAQPDPKIMAELEAIARKYAFKDFDAWNRVAGNIAIVLDGIDPETRAYVGAEARVKKAIAEAEADAKLSAADRKASLQALEQERRNITPVQFKGNVDLVIKHYDALNGDDAAPAK